MKSLDKRQITGIKIAVIGIASIAVIMLALTLSTTSKPAYEFKTGMDHPEFVSLYSKSHPLVLFIYHNCSRCEDYRLKMVVLQAQLRGVSLYPDTETQAIVPPNTSPLIFFAYIGVDGSTLSHDIAAKNYGVESLPIVLVIRGDGATAKFGPADDQLDFSAIRSAINDAEIWKEAHSTPTPIPTVITPTPPPDYSSYFDQSFESGTSIMDRPFTKSINSRGNEVYKGVVRNASLPKDRGMTTVVELTTSKAQAKLLYDQTVAQKIKEGFTPRYDWIAQDKAAWPWVTEDWTGQLYGNGQQFGVRYLYSSELLSWELITQAG